MTGKALILGASGKIGRHSANAFQAAGWTVKKYDRASNDMPLAAKGCDVIVNGLNPPNYKNWDVAIPKITREVIEAARESGATVIIPGNVYHFGNQPGVWSENTPARPVSRKGGIRLAMEEAYEASGVQTIVLRAGNFIDPDRQDCVMSLIYMRDIARDRITLPGSHEVNQAMCYVPDWAKAAVELAEKRASLSRFEDIPFPGYTLSGNDIKSELEKLLNRPLRFTRFPWWALKIASPFWTLAREMQEMRYLWNTDHALSGEKFGQLLNGFEATPLEEVLRSALPPELSR